jgi:hypothetical protein
VLLANVTSPVWVAVDSQNVYFSYTNGLGVVTKAGQQVGLYPTGSAVSGIATDGTNAYYSLDNGAVAEWSPGGKVSTLYQEAIKADAGAADNSWNGVAAIGTNLYWFYNHQIYGGPGNSGAILRAPKVGGGGTGVVYSTPLNSKCSGYCSLLTNLVGDANGVYWVVRDPAGTVMHSDIGFASPTSFGIPPQSNINGLAIDATYVYWVTFDFAADGGQSAGVYRIGRDGTGYTQLAVLPGGSTAMAVDSSGIYISYEFIYRIPLGGGKPVALATSGVGTPEEVATDASAIYWADVNGRIMKLAK